MNYLIQQYRIQKYVQRDDPIRYNEDCKNPKTIAPATMASRLASTDTEEAKVAIQAFSSGLDESNLADRYKVLYETLTHRGMLTRLLDFFRGVPEKSVQAHAVRLIALSKIAELMPSTPASTLHGVRLDEKHPPLLDRCDRDLASGIGNSLNWLLAHTSDGSFADFMNFTHGDCSFIGGSYEGMVSFKNDGTLGPLAGIQFPCKGLRVDPAVVGASAERQEGDIGTLVAAKIQLAKGMKQRHDAEPILSGIRALLQQANTKGTAPELKQSAIAECLPALKKLCRPERSEGIEKVLDEYLDTIRGNMSGWIATASPQFRAACYLGVYDIAASRTVSKPGSGFLFPMEFVKKNLEYATSYVQALIQSDDPGAASCFSETCYRHLDRENDSVDLLRTVKSLLTEVTAASPARPVREKMIKKLDAAIAARAKPALNAPE